MDYASSSIQNPAQYFIDFNQSMKAWTWYDKEKKGDIPIALPAYFILINSLHGIAGVTKFRHGQKQSGIYSNEISNIKSDVLHVRSYDRSVDIVGIYHNIIDKAKRYGASYSKPTYALMVSAGGQVIQPTLIHLHFKGAARTAFINSKARPGSVIGLMNEFVQGEGQIQHWVPKIVAAPMSEQQKAKYHELCLKVNDEVNEYLRVRSNAIEDLSDTPQDMGDDKFDDQQGFSSNGQGFAQQHQQNLDNQWNEQFTNNPVGVQFSPMTPDQYFQGNQQQQGNLPNIDDQYEIEDDLPF